MPGWVQAVTGWIVYLARRGSKIQTGYRRQSGNFRRIGTVMSVFKWGRSVTGLLIVALRDALKGCPAMFWPAPSRDCPVRHASLPLS